MLTAPKEASYPARPKEKIDRSLPSRSSHLFIGTIREFFLMPVEVEFRISERGKRADDPPEGYFMCYKAYLVRCRLWFPIPVAMI